MKNFILALVIPILCLFSLSQAPAGVFQYADYQLDFHSTMVMPDVDVEGSIPLASTDRCCTISKYDAYNDSIAVDLHKGSCPVVLARAELPGSIRMPGLAPGADDSGTDSHKWYFRIPDI